MCIRDRYKSHHFKRKISFFNRKEFLLVKQLLYLELQKPAENQGFIKQTFLAINSGHGNHSKNSPLFCSQRFDLFCVNVKDSNGSFVKFSLLII